MLIVIWTLLILLLYVICSGRDIICIVTRFLSFALFFIYFRVFLRNIDSMHALECKLELYALKKFFPALNFRL